MTFYSCIKEILNWLYTLSGIAVTLTIFIGIKQVRHMQKDSADNLYRQSIDKAVEYITRFSEITLPALKDYQAKIANKNPKTWSKKSEYSFEVSDEERELLYKIDIIEIGKLGIFKIINELEILSIGVNTGMINDETVFGCIGKLFCEAVESTYDAICYFRVVENAGLFNNIEKLYKEWRPKFEDIISTITVDIGV
ncbi:DUF4760 domain-containing protein [Ruminiclostridium cellulolyticum]|uniref:DUF4760 domain-containing protein n=1 Tax=Ruminiclostridium cellulolyticum (strain ATCC 35319 / DSM 5812 / JCM 6584 / H10) TaxID=394503 RepID=B8I4A7_RUMCH|nr:hypothetical protein [Ruminiclostridium cellulolyticum]ACL74461.1 hypothetical protein Ccel_0073 [Ruminiclostridium cellulolyticum H10]